MLRGKIERIENGYLFGWLWDTDTDDPVDFELSVNEVPVGTFKADLPRADLKSKAIGTGAHAFRIRIDAAWTPLSLNRFNAVQLPLRRNLNRELISYTVQAAGSETKPTLILASSMSELRECIKVAFGELFDVEPPNQRAPANEAMTEPHRPKLPAVTTFKPLKPRNLPRTGWPVLDWGQQRDLLRKLVELGNLTEKQVAPIMEAAMKAAQSSTATILGEAVEHTFAPSYRILNNVGRSYMQLGEFDRAATVLKKLRELEPTRHAAIFYLGVAHARQQRYAEAYETFLHCISVQPAVFRYQFEAARAAVLIRFGGYGVYEERPEFLATALKHFAAAYALETKDAGLLREYARLLMHANRIDEAMDLARRATELAPKHEASWSELSKVHLRSGQFTAALEASRTALKLSPSNDGAKFAVRILTRLAETERAGGAEPRLALLGEAGESKQVGRILLHHLPPPPEADIEPVLSRLEVDWVCFDPDVDISHTAGSAALAERLLPWAAGVEIGVPPRSAIAWRRDFLLALLQSGAGRRDAGLPGLLALAERTAAVVRIAPPAANLSLQLAKAGVVLLISQYGIYRFGGAEQFLSQMARIYADLGFQVLMVGTRPEHIGQSGTSSGLRYTFVDGSPEEILRLALEEDAAVVHVVSGLGFEIASALRYLDLRLVFGIHFWRELFFNPTPSSGYFPDIDRRAVPRPDFKIVVDDFHALYANSVFTRQVVERHFGVRTPIIYSLPDDTDADVTVSSTDRDCVLLVNARSDKGFDLTAEIALRAPEVRFLAIASQSDLAAAEAVLAQKGVTNIEMIARAEDMPALYRRARVVLVPSFRFVETFSRVVIEAHRFGTPVIGSDRGNVPYLLTESGIALGEDPDLWAAEVRRLWTDDGYWSAMSGRAIENSARYAFSAQKNRLKGLLSSVQTPILVGIGSGLGNVIHTTPLIRNLAKRLGRRVDVVVAGDYADLLFVPAREEYVNVVMLLNDVALRRRYDTVFLTHSFGSVTPSFASTRVVASRDWDNFAADHQMHEAEFNLAAAQALLGVPYDADDVDAYYLGDFTYKRPSATLVGVHGGSKGGIWASKRWPHYAELGRELIKRDIAVASFGTAEEYVEGTIDMTGGSIEEMATRMLACSAFLANDSGVMNVANALGIPLLALFGPTNAATRGPLGPTSRSIAIEKPCAPCETHATERRARFLDGSCRCIADIEMAEVLTTLTRLLDPLPASA